MGTSRGPGRLLPLPTSSEGWAQLPHTPRQPHQERKQVLQLLFIDIQVGSIATGPRWLQQPGKWQAGGVFAAATAEWSAGTEVHEAPQNGRGENLGGWRSNKVPGPVSLTRSPAPDPAAPLCGCLLTPGWATCLGIVFYRKWTQYTKETELLPSRVYSPAPILCPSLQWNT